MPFAAKAKVGSGLPDAKRSDQTIPALASGAAAHHDTEGEGGSPNATARTRINSLRRAFVPKITSLAVLKFIKKEREKFRNNVQSDAAELATCGDGSSSSRSPERGRSVSPVADDSDVEQTSNGAIIDNASTQASPKPRDACKSDGVGARPTNLRSHLLRPAIAELPSSSVMAPSSAPTTRRKSESNCASSPSLDSRPGTTESYFASGNSLMFPLTTPPNDVLAGKPSEVGMLNPLDRKYLNRTTNGAEAFSLIEMFNSLDEKGEGWLSVEKDLPIAYKMVGVPKHKQPLLKVDKLDTFSFCKLIGDLQREQLTISDVTTKLGASMRVSRRLMESKNLGATAEVVLSDQEIDVFLGGACNPTTWRTKEAIPFCTRFGIRFYNPQVDEWHPDLVAVEQRAKVKSKLLLYVITTETRAIASMVEAAELATSGRNMVLVLTDYTADDAASRGMSVDEMKDLNRGRAYLADVAERHKCPTFEDINNALVEVARRLSVKRKSHQRSGSARV